MASTMGTALGSTQGSWRPFAASVVASPLALIVCCSLRIVAVGLKATRSTMGSPLLIPPWIPPELLVAVCKLPSRIRAYGHAELGCMSAGCQRIAGKLTCGNAVHAELGYGGSERQTI